MNDFRGGGQDQWCDEGELFGMPVSSPVDVDGVCAWHQHAYSDHAVEALLRFAGVAAAHNLRVPYIDGDDLALDGADDLRLIAGVGAAQAEGSRLGRDHRDLVHRRKADDARGQGKCRRSRYCGDQQGNHGDGEKQFLDFEHLRDTP